MDYFRVVLDHPKRDVVEVKAEPLNQKCKDLMIRGKDFYAVWDGKMWSEDVFTVVYQMDNAVHDKVEELKKDPLYDGTKIIGKYLVHSDNGRWNHLVNHFRLSYNNYHELNRRVVFANEVGSLKKEDYVSETLPYSLDEGEPQAYTELMSKLYKPEELQKIEWAIGSVIAGDSVKIQKFLVLYGEGGTGKSTVLNIIKMLFGVAKERFDDEPEKIYWTSFKAETLVGGKNQFPLEPFKKNPLIAIDPDARLDRIEDNTILNTIISHEETTMNEKGKPQYGITLQSMLFLGTNTPVKITDAKSGLIRRLIDVVPSGKTFDYDRYQELTGRIKFELGQIANHCLQVYKELGIGYYNKYRARNMILETNEFYNFIMDNEDAFTEHGGITMRAAYKIYKEYVEEAGLKYQLPLYRFSSEIKNYFENFEERPYIDGVQVRSWLSGFKADKFRAKEAENHPSKYFLTLDQESSLFDVQYSWIPAAYARSEDGGPWIESWDTCERTLGQLDTHKTHFCRPPENMIVLDFDLRDENGDKSPELNLMEASKWPPTYAEFSKSGGGIHLHYFYNGDVKMLNKLVSNGIELKTFDGKNSLRRKLSKCNNLPIATLTSGLPLREVNDMVDNVVIQNETHLIRRIVKRMTKPNGISTLQSIKLIKKDLDDAYAAGIHYDLTNMKPDVLAFANNSTNNAAECVRIYLSMKFQSEDASTDMPYGDDAPLVFFDIEVYPNLLLLVWKVAGKDNKCNIVFNPSTAFLEQFFKMKLIGFNNLRYDNPILYARYEGASTERCYEISQGLIGGSFRPSRESVNVSYTDVFDFCRTKQSLKKWEVYLKQKYPEKSIKHQEMYLDWNKPAPKDKWDEIAAYCCNDVIATEEVFYENYSDFEARQILVAMSNALGINACVNDTTNQLTTKLIIRGIKNPQSHFVYTDLSTIFPGYEFKDGKSTYKGIDPGEGGYVFSKPGMYQNVWTFDVDSMHPHSALALKYFGDLTPNFKELVDLRMMIKNGQFEEVGKMFNGALMPYIDLSDPAKTKKKLGDALKLAINSVYGLTAAHFPNALRMEENVDNIIAKYGALFMIDLKEEVEKRGYEVVHVKTDSIKIVEPKEDVITFITDFAAKYGFKFKIESKYERFCLVNKAVYIAREEGKWEPTGAQFAHPYVLKKLFTKEPITLSDLTETKSVTTQMYLDFNEAEPENHSYYFVGKVGLFVPVKPGSGGGELLREKDGKYSAVTGTKGYRWKEFDVIQTLKLEDQIDYTYFDELANEAISTISQFGDFEAFTADDKEEELEYVS